MPMKQLPANTPLEVLISERRNDVTAVAQLEQTRLIGRNMTLARAEPVGLEDSDRIGDVWHGSSYLYVCAGLADGTRKWKKISWTDV